MTNGLKQQFDELDLNDFDSTIKLYENNSLYFSNYNLITDKELIIDLIEMKIQYSYALFETSKFKKSLTILKDVDILLQKIKEEEIFKKFSINALFLEGMNKSWLKKYDEAKSIFEELLREDPENDRYKDWYLNIRTHLFAKQLSLISIFGFIVILINIIGKLTNYYIMDSSIQIFGWVLVVAGGVLPKVREYWIKYTEKI
jgi:tetratricopeptide (TPR) repeat protein